MANTNETIKEISKDIKTIIHGLEIVMGDKGFGGIMKEFVELKKEMISLKKQK